MQIQRICVLIIANNGHDEHADDASQLRHDRRHVHRCCRSDPRLHRPTGPAQGR